MTQKISLVSTVLNDRQGAINLLTDLKNQTRMIDEFVVVDGGSTDGTYEFLLHQITKLPFSLKLIQNQGANVSQGRNQAIANTTHNIILSTDFGCRLDPNWVKELATPFELHPDTEIVTGSWKIPDKDIQTPAQWAEWALSNGKIELIATPTCLASTRSIAFLKQIWIDFGKYPEDLTLTGDDAIFSLWMVSANKKIIAAPKAICYWHRFPKLKNYWKEAKRNFRGAGEAIFFLKYGIKVGIMFLLEISSLLTILILPLTTIQPTQIALILAITILIWSKRLLRWFQAIKLLSKVGKIAYWPWVLALELGLRFYGIYGYWFGFIYGYFHCQNCRSRMTILGIQRW